MGLFVGMRRMFNRKGVGGVALLAALVQFSSAMPPMPPPPAPPPDFRGIFVPLPTTPQPGQRRVLARQAPLPLGGGSPVTIWREHAEDDSQVTATLGSARPVVQSDVVSEGAGAFHLATPALADESILLNPIIVPEVGTKLFFESRLTIATTNQVARVQASTNNGSTWDTLWSQAGKVAGEPGNYGEVFFRPVAVPLLAYTGISIRLRFLYEFTGVSAYTNTDTTLPPYGWFIDDIQIGASLVKRPFSGFGDPTAEEIQMLEFINRARADAAAEAVRLKTTTDPDVTNATKYFNVNFTMMVSQFATLTQKTQPLSMNAKLTASARLHSQDMFSNVFQGHDSSTNPPWPNQPGDSVGARVLRQGYDCYLVNENVYAYAKSPWFAHAGFNIDWGTNAGGMQVPPGHRLTIHDGSFREVGVGLVSGINSKGSNTVGPLLVTQDFGIPPLGGHPFIIGVTYGDANTNNFYDPGEGIGGVTVDVEGSHFDVVSSTHGVYSVPVSANGTYTIRFHRPGFTPITTTAVITNGLSAKADYRGEWVRIDSVERLSVSNVRVVAARGLTPETVGLLVSGDLVSWTNLPASATEIGNGRTQLDATLSNTPAKAFFKVKTTWSSL